MNRIEDERIKFYLEHEAQIREWADLEAEVCKFADRFYRSLKGDLDAALRSGRIDDDGVEVFLAGGDWPRLGLRRQDWPEGDEEPDVSLEWSRKSSGFPRHAGKSRSPYCGVRTSVKEYKVHFPKEVRPYYQQSPGWPAWRYVDPPDDGFWEGENLKQYRDDLVETILTAWKDLAPLVDEAVGHPPR